MQDLTVSLVQTHQFWEDKAKNLAHFEDLLNKHLHCPTDVIVFPEMFHTGFSMNTELLAEEMKNSVGIQWLSKVAKERDALCLASLIVKDSGGYFNRMVAVFPNGDLEYYDKIHLFTLANEDKNFSAGQKRKIVTYRGWRILLQVCYDLRFPENARNSFLADGTFEFDTIVYVANWPARRIAHWNLLLPARAIENQCYVLAVNRVGEDENELSYTGCSQIITPLGEYILEPKFEIEGVFTFSLNKEMLSDTRSKLAFLKDRKI
jgi:predicted amidohydrolase